MEKNVADTIKEFLEGVMKSVVTPAADHPFNVSGTTVRLKGAEGRALHKAMSGLLLLCNR